MRFGMENAGKNEADGTRWVNYQQANAFQTEPNQTADCRE